MDSELLHLLLTCSIIALLPSWIAWRKGYSFCLWWVYGTLLFIIALIHLIALSPNVAKLEKRRIQEEGMKRCPYCSEIIKGSANVCRYCGRDFVKISKVMI